MLWIIKKFDARFAMFIALIAIKISNILKKKIITIVRKERKRDIEYLTF